MFCLVLVFRSTLRKVVLTEGLCCPVKPEPSASRLSCSAREGWIQLDGERESSAWIRLPGDLASGGSDRVMSAGRCG